MKKRTKIIISFFILLTLILIYEYLIHLWAFLHMKNILRLEIFLAYPFIILFAILFYKILNKLKKKQILFSSFVFILIFFIGVALFFSPVMKPSKEFLKKFIIKQNEKANTISDKIKAKLHLPKEISKNILISGNPDAKTVLINTQGGPTTAIISFELDEMLDSANLKNDDLLIVNVHQYQTLRTDEFENKLISFEDAKKYNEISTKILAEVVEYFKKENKKVIVVGISFGALMLTNLLSNYPAIADKYIAVVGRIDMPERIWKSFAEGKYVGFKYKNNGEFEIVKFSAEEAGMGGGNSIGDKNTMLLAAGLAYKRFDKLLKNKDLKNLIYFYGIKDEQVGGLSQKEINFLKTKKVPVVGFNKNHEKSIDEFLEKYLKKIITEVKK